MREGWEGLQGGNRLQGQAVREGGGAAGREQAVREGWEGTGIFFSRHFQEHEQHRVDGSGLEEMEQAK